ncbi:hypothetical protein M758_8G179800, partial [Ceratodon purpureus]
LGAVAPAVTTGARGEGGVSTAGRVEGGPLKDGDLSLGFGYAPRVPVSLSDAVPPGTHAGLWGRPTGGGYRFNDAGAGLGVGLAGQQREIFRDILSRGEEFGSAYAEALLKRDSSERERAVHQQQQQQQQHQQQHQHQHHYQQQQQQQQQQQHQQHHHQHQQSLQGVQRPVIVGEGPNYGDGGRGEAGESSSSGSVEKGGHPGGAGAGVEPWAARALREEVVRGMDVQPLAEARTPQHNPQGVGNVVDAVAQVHQLQLDAGKQHRVPPQVAAPDPKVMGHGSTACQECGNQAKKDCSFQRCRTCCKSRDFDCATHVKSTWVPASKRRERQAAEAAAAAAGQPRPKSKRARILALAAPAGATTSMTTTSANSPRGSDINSGHPSQPAQARGGLPPEVRAQALFKCVRVTGVEDGENEFAYQATVKIGGHIFKGVLYDQGLDLAQQAVTSNPSELQLGGGGGGAGGVRGNLPSSSPLLDPSGMYGPGNALLGGEDSRVAPWFT